MPTTGERFFVERPSLNAETVQLGIEACADACPASLNLLLLDHGGAPTAPRLRWPEHVRAVWWPPYGPELNPIARVWRDLKDELAWEPCAELAAPQDDVSDRLQAYEAPTLQALTGYRDLVNAIHALCA